MIRLSSVEQDMMFKWMELANPGIKCSHLHPDTTCAYQVYYKASRCVGQSFKVYIVLHLIPFLLYKIKKIKNWKKFKDQSVSLVKKYVRSLCFMSAFVCSIKVFLCFSQKITKPEPTLEGKVFIWGSLLSALSMFFEDSHRREEIVYFVFVRAVRSIYEWAKKRRYFSIPNEEATLFILLFSMLSYIFDQQKDRLKNSDSLQKIWGTS